VERLRFFILVLMLFFMATLVNLQQRQTRASAAKRSESPLVGDIGLQLVHARPVPITQFSQRSESLQSKTPSPGQILYASFMGDLRLVGQRVERNKRTATSSYGPEGYSVGENANALAIFLEYHLKLLEHKEAGLNKCLAASDRTAAKRRPEEGCSISQFLSFWVAHDREGVHKIPIWRQPESYAVFYESGLSIDADGAPNTYHPDNIGLDDLSNAGAPGFWEALAQDANGDPYIQGPDDPFPGYYVSTTALTDGTKALRDPARYVDASKIPYIVLPTGLKEHVAARLGDFAVVFNLQNLRCSPAIFADTGPTDRIGEGSIALAENLGLWPDARNGGTARGILYLVFPGSGNGSPRPAEEIKAEAEKLFSDWSGNNKLTACGIR
jgi:Fungal chitosanase of glycosyl hydrolase group 75